MIGRIDRTILLILAITIVLSLAPVFAADFPSAPEASPDVYKILAENDQWRVIEATWEPGQEDNLHYHTADRVSLYPTDCHLRLTSTEGRYIDFTAKAGTANARTGKPVKAFKARNIGDTVCIIRIVELK